MQVSNRGVQIRLDVELHLLRPQNEQALLVGEMRMFHNGRMPRSPSARDCRADCQDMLSFPSKLPHYHVPHILRQNRIFSLTAARAI